MKSYKFPIFCRRLHYFGVNSVNYRQLDFSVLYDTRLIEKYVVASFFLSVCLSLIVFLANWGSRTNIL